MNFPKKIEYDTFIQACKNVVTKIRTNECIRKRIQFGLAKSETFHSVVSKIGTK